jgi:hypothetical protein
MPDCICRGAQVRGRSSSTEIPRKRLFWDLEWFGGELHRSTISALFRLQSDKLARVQFGSEVVKTCNQLSATTEVLWSVGEKDVLLSFDGKSWTRIV